MHLPAKMMVKVFLGMAVLAIFAAVIMPAYKAKIDKQKAAQAAEQTDEAAAQDKTGDGAKPSPMSSAKAAPVAQTVSQTAPKAAESATKDAATQAQPAPKPTQPKPVKVAAVKPAEPKIEAPQFRTVTRRDCKPRIVTVQVEVPDAPAAQPERNPIGLLAGAALGALAGNQVGQGNGKTLATLAGAAGGAIAGDKLANGSTTAPKTGTHMETRQVETEICYDTIEQFRVN